jgi:hypothetical protein
METVSTFIFPIKGTKIFIIHVVVYECLNYEKKKFKQLWSIIPPISTKRTITSNLNSLNIKTGCRKSGSWLGTGTKMW